ncbi:TPA: transcription termination/antitermination protein NusA [candidate division CPR2 bacterium]|uniref:Transcription termination/antitermination protein NusA n=1 Tax=candidate division CPR2 bacterium GW2011_GWC1_41_48 TaxID=1618344 RepID=A0A0G0YHL9_UNCC2|nr:MAG: Transcription termination factor NusA [candidate division CPR2 bacterium GW2011_GWC2_39_35]KKR27351.1 MAG: Transcription termination factor NusA [candidate division CPR2 bacterium GW2011_GWD2_39_7]KKS09061.1 MAG: Transcription termination factor NusA [candidate division CPR2 bacterium GW2011_GWC1_41_48]OGB70827.1 MAG: transcription termination/antitermination protein NusA [candidate division CPR2 bacterium GWD2_39_7]HBG81864.1 transcription termination/antitermination protein NusA [cand
MEDKKFMAAINQICAEKNIPKEIVLETVEAALAAAFKKDYGQKDQEVRVTLDEETGHPNIYVLKEVSDEVENEYFQISLDHARKLKKDAKVGDTIEIQEFVSDFGRIAAQTAKQVIIQRIREAERDIVFSEYKEKEGDLVNGIVQRIEGNNIFVDLGRATGVVFPQEQVQGERYYNGQRLKVFIVKVEQSSKGPQILLSRSHPGMIKKLFELEVPEIVAGTVEIKSIAREAGQRSKIAVSSSVDGVDPVGSLVGQRGIRVQSVMAEIGDEKIDVILWNEDPKVYVSNALSPAKVNEVIVEEAEKRAKVRVPEDQLSLAIGKQGQNVRLAAKLTGWNIDILGADEYGIEATADAAEQLKAKRDIEEEIIKALETQDETEIPEGKPRGIDVKEEATES